MVWGMAVAQLVSWGTLYYAFPLMVAPMRRSLGWSLPLLNGALSLGLLFQGIVSVPVGAWIDRRGGRGVMMAGSLLGALALGVWAAAGTPLAFYLAWLMVGASMAGTLYEPAFTVITARFRADASSAIIALALVGGLASTVCMPATQVLISRLGWRAALGILAGANLAICLPLHALFVPRGRPAAAGAAQAPQAGSLAHVYRDLAGKPRFWGLALWFKGTSLVTAALVFQLVPVFTEWRLSIPAVLGCMMLLGPMQVAGRVLWMALGKRAGVCSMGLVSIFAFIAALAGLLYFPHRPVWMGAGVALFGLGNGILTILRGTAVPEVLGPENYGTINGVLALAVLGARAAGPVAAAALWAWAGRPEGMLSGLLACTLVGGAGYLLAVAGPRGREATAPGN